MEQHSCLFVSMPVAKTALVEWYADMFVNDRAALIEFMQDGQMSAFNADKWDNKFIIDRLGELNVMEKYAIKAQQQSGTPVSKVFIQNIEEYWLVWDIENIEPAKRAERLAAAA